MNMSTYSSLTALLLDEELLTFPRLSGAGGNGCSVELDGALGGVSVLLAEMPILRRKGRR
jgi:hypothetical protein